MTLRGRYGDLTRRVDELERRAAGRGCGPCRDWPAYPVAYEDGPVPGWPAGLRCPACGRAPAGVFRVVYEDQPPPPPLLGGLLPEDEPD